MEPINRDGPNSDHRTLMSSVAKGDRSAFETVYQETYGKVARYVNGLVQDQSTAEDVLVQTYTVAWQKASNFRGDGKVTTWLIGIARNIAFKEFRKSRPTTQFDESYTASDDTSQRKPEQNDLSSKMKDALMVLSAKHKETLELVFFQGLTYPEISELMNVPVNTIKTRVFHAKKALKDELIKRKITPYES